MIRLFLLLWFTVCSQAWAAPVSVKSGEHEGFTRLVLDFGVATDWAVGRTSDGYELRATGASPIYDLSQTFDLIGKNRLAALWADPASGALRIGIACACHVIPFEFRPGIIVMDLRDGPPPKGSSFEATLDDVPQNALQAKPVPRPRLRPVTEPNPYVWIDTALASVQSKPKTDLSVMPSSDPSMEPIRNTLLRQLSRGAAQGIVEMALPKQPQQPLQETQPAAAIKVGLNSFAGISYGTADQDHSDLSADGEICTDTAALDLASWGSEAPVAEQFATAMTGLTGEFDRPDEPAIARAVKFNLFLGFGAEAKQLMRAFPSGTSDYALWSSLAHIMEGEPNQDTIFRGQLACDNPSALWAMLTDPKPTKADAINRKAVILAFSGLPAALRRQLGPELIERFLALDDPQTADALRNAIVRAPGETDAEVAVMEAKIDLSNDDPVAAEARMNEVLSEPGRQNLKAVLELVQARTAQNLPVDASVVTSLTAAMAEEMGGPDEAEFQNAIALAQAASGDFDGAFVTLASAPGAEADLWRLLAHIGTDDAVLAHAVLKEDQAQPKVTHEASELLAERLLDLGMARPSQRWLQGSDNQELLVRSYLGIGDARSALSSLGNGDTQKGLALRAEALRMLNDKAAAQAFADANDALGQQRILAQTRDWEQLGLLIESEWEPSVRTLAPTKVDPTAGPLARGYQLIEGSAQTRSVISKLLQSQPR